MSELRVVQCRICEFHIAIAEWGRNRHSVHDTCLCRDGEEDEVNAIDMLGEIGQQFIALEKDVGRSVIYQAHADAPNEDGVITSVNDEYVFVRYAGDKGSKATNPRDLRWLSD